VIRRLCQAIARWHHRATIKDLDWQIRVHEAHLAALPAEIRRLGELRRFHIGRVASLTVARNPVNWRLGRRRSTPSH